MRRVLACRGDEPGLRLSYCGSTLCPSPGILNTTKRNVSETVSVTVLMPGEETPTLLGPLERADLAGFSVIEVSSL
jgi:hypothetical protein